MGQLLSWQEEQLGIRSDTQPPLLSPLSLEDSNPPQTPKNHISNVSFNLVSKFVQRGTLHFLSELLLSYLFTSFSQQVATLPSRLHVPKRV